VVPEFLPLHQPVEELEKLSAQKTLSFTANGLAYAQMVWNKELGPFQQITSMAFSLSGSALAIKLTEVVDNRVFHLEGRLHDINHLRVSRA